MHRTHPLPASCTTNGQRLELAARQDPELRRLVLAVRTWALANGRPVDAEPLIAVLGTLLADAREEGVPIGAWNEPRVIELVWMSCLQWCLDREISPPEGVPGALRRWWAYLAATDGFEAGSDTLAVLDVALQSCTAGPPLQRRRGRRAHPSGSGTLA